MTMKNKYLEEYDKEMEQSPMFDGDPYEYMIFSSNCINCKHWEIHSDDLYQCKAFPDGIPPEIWTGKISHDNPYEGDHGIQFEPKEK